uniref:Uncharacterized protein n=1 Tax=Rhipicephalus pulchellus TaxID=72859 RepID=L7LZ27_RHIPC
MSARYVTDFKVYFSYFGDIGSTEFLETWCVKSLAPSENSVFHVLPIRNYVGTSRLSSWPPSHAPCYLFRLILLPCRCRVEQPAPPNRRYHLPVYVYGECHCALFAMKVHFYFVLFWYICICADIRKHFIPCTFLYFVFLFGVQLWIMQIVSACIFLFFYFFVFSYVLYKS